MRPEVANLLAQADEDTTTALSLIDTRRWSASVFLSHQATNRRLEALYVVEKLEHPRMHDLTRICRGLDAPEGVCLGAWRLNRHYVTSRYPGAANGVPAEQYDEAQAREYRKIAMEIAEWVRSKIE